MFQLEPSTAITIEDGASEVRGSTPGCAGIPTDGGFNKLGLVSEVLLRCV